jgi:hypothetical protein
LEWEIAVPDAERIACAAAQALAADVDPSLPARVERALNGGRRDGDTAFLIDAARHACRVAGGTTPNGGPLSAAFIERRLRRELGLDDGMAPELEAMVTALALAVAAARPPG